MGYQIILWTLNSKDWVSFARAEKITNYLLKKIKAGYIILFHDSGNTFSTEGGDRANTVKTISRLIPALQARGYRLVTVSELLRQAATPTQTANSVKKDSEKLIFPRHC